MIGYANSIARNAEMHADIRTVSAGAAVITLASHAVAAVRV